MHHLHPPSTSTAPATRSNPHFPSFLPFTVPPIILHPLPTLVNFTKGENISLTCVALGRPTIRWLHNGRQMGGEGIGSLQLSIVNTMGLDMQRRSHLAWHGSGRRFVTASPAPALA